MSQLLHVKRNITWFSVVAALLETKFYSNTKQYMLLNVLTSAQTEKVFARLGTNIRKELKYNAPNYRTWEKNILTNGFSQKQERKTFKRLRQV